MSKKRPFGYHLILDLYDCDCDKLGSVEYCYHYLDVLPEMIGTDKQAPPYVILTDEKKYPNKAGISGWIPVVDSGISIHTIVPKKFVSIDIYTCKKFNPKKLKEFTIKYFRPKRVDEKYFLRAEDYFN